MPHVEFLGFSLLFFAYAFSSETKMKAKEHKNSACGTMPTRTKGPVNKKNLVGNDFNMLTLLD